MIQSAQQIASVLAALTLTLQGMLAGITSNNQMAQVTPVASISLSPSSTSVTSGNTFTVSIVVNTGGQSIYGVDINRLRFNPSILQVVDSDATATGVQISAGAILPLTIINSVDNVSGTIQFSQLANPGNTYNGSGTLATITFRGVSTGSSNATLDFSLGSGTDTNVAGLGGDLLASVSNGIYVVSTPADTTAPSVPANLVASAASQSQINLSWSASTDPTVAGQVTSGLSGYRVERCVGSSCSNFLQISTPSTNSYSDTGLSANTLYNYRVRAVDVAGNLSQYSTSNSTSTRAVPKSPKKIRLQTLQGRSTLPSYPQATVYVLEPSLGSLIDTQTLSADAMGDYTVTFGASVPTLVNLRVAFNGYLTRLISGVDTTLASAYALIPEPKAGDFNSDMLINSLDFSYMNSNWGSADQLADINRDNMVNSLDFAYISSNWLQSGE